MYNKILMTDNKILELDNTILDVIRTSSIIPFHSYPFHRSFPIPIG
jgi:hypothetical protein